MAEPRTPGARAVVIGAGPAGLLAARDLLARGHVVTVLEASARPGGRVTSLELDGLLLDAGAESFATRNDAVARLAAELGLTTVQPAQKPAWVVAPGRAYPLPSTGWLGIPTNPLDASVRSVVGAAAALHASLEPHRGLGEIDDDVTVGALVRDRLGEEIAERLVAPVLAGIYSRPIDALRFADMAPGAVEALRQEGSLVALARTRRASRPAGAAVAGIEGGMWRLTAALADAVESGGGRIVTSTPAERLSFADGVWHIHAGGGTVVADMVVLAVPMAAARGLLPGLPSHEQRSVDLVTLVLDAPELAPAPRGTGVLAMGDVSQAKALTHSTAKWPWLARAAGGREVVRLSYSAGIDGIPVDVALADASRLLATDLRPEQVRAHAIATWVDAAPGEAPAVDEPGLFVVGSAAGLTGLTAIVGADFPWAA